jgi:ribosomal protein L10
MTKPDEYEGLQLQAMVSIKASIDIEDPAAIAVLRAHDIDPTQLHEVRKLGDDINQLVNVAVQTALGNLLATDVAGQVALSMTNGSVVVPAGTKVQPTI